MSTPAASFLSVATQTTATESTIAHAFNSIGLRTPAARWLAIGSGVMVAAGIAAALWTKQQKKPRILPCRPLHWVLKVSDLRASVDFYSRVLGLVVTRHEEFDTGCEATCNGPYSGWWSKTMMGFPEVGENAFSLELTFNYGIESYTLGNDLVGIHVAVAGAAERAKEMGLQVLPTEQAGVSKVQNPDGQWFFLHDPLPSADPAADPFLFISLNTTDMQRAKDFYINVLGMSEFSATEAKVSSSASSSNSSAPSTCLLGFSARETKVQLVQLNPGQTIDHGASFGRIAFGGFEVERTYARAVAAGDVVLNAPISLTTAGKASVTVTILKDRDGNEICVVDDGDFRRLCKTNPGDELVKWESRDKRIRQQLKFQKAFGGQ